MPRALWLADALRAEGVKVVENPGWFERGSATFSPRGVICHHTAGPARGDAPSLHVCINGRPGLPGPLCQIVLARSGTAHVIASGRANHAGVGGWRGLEGNTSVFGIEAENTGVGEPWPPVQYEAYVRCVAALCRKLQLPVGMVCGHKEWAPKRKIDPAGIDMVKFRADVLARLGAVSPAPNDPQELTVADIAALMKKMDQLAAAQAATDLRVQRLEQDLIDGDRPDLGTVPKRTLASLSRIESQTKG